MKEEFLQYIWANSLYKGREFTTFNGKKIKILSPGEFNRDAGPDFFYARIETEDFVLAGNIEIHLRSSDWYRHGHHKDAAYNNVILSVVQTDDVRIYNSKGEEIECIVLDFAGHLYDEYVYMRDSRYQPGCQRNLELIDDDWFYLTLQSLAIERLERKVGEIARLLTGTKNDWEECFYRLLCKYWSGNVNAGPFYQLALHLPYKILLKYADRENVAEALLLGVSGLLNAAGKDSYTSRLKQEYAYFKAKHSLVEMPVEQWKYMRIRPEGFPTVRLALLAVFLCRFGSVVSRLLEARTVNEVMDLLDVEATSYWDTHYSFQKTSVSRKKRMGAEIRQIIVINAIIPFLFIYGRELNKEELREKAVCWLEEMKPEKNYIVNAWKKCGFVFDSALQTQALIELRKEYCDRHLCLKCRIGREVLKSSGCR